ncbi:MAG: DUF167 domain-containing protein [Candidatus Omnitrophota bacterium]
MSERIVKLKVITRASSNRLKPEGDTLKVYTTSVPEKDKANKSVIKLVADFFNAEPSQVQILSGRHSKDKIIQIRT